MSTREQEDGGGHGMLSVAFLLVMVGLAVAVLPKINFQSVVPNRVTSHARTSHISTVSKIENCFNGDGELSNTFQMPDGRWSQYCKDPNGKNNHWRIYECEKPGMLTLVTQFTQTARESKLKNYIRNKKMAKKRLDC